MNKKWKWYAKGLTGICVGVCLQVSPAFAAGTQTADNRTTNTQTAEEQTGDTQVAAFTALSEEERVEIIGEVCQEDYQTSGILASVSAAQCILESGYMSTDLAVEANNCFGMKVVLSGNTWADSVWDGVSSYTKNTHEEYNGQDVVITAAFRKYACMEDSVADHSAYLLGATDDNGLRYEGLKGETDYTRAIQIIKSGGYATDSRYVDKICNIIQRFDLTRFDVKETSANTAKSSSAKHTTVSPDYKGYYHVRQSLDKPETQIGAYYVLDNAKKVCRKGYSIYDDNGNTIMTGTTE
ncbi:MAG: glucosaminidase domain-containing protein [Lachnospiraceae bacterium]|nr:glucosaminidase domain-containing protein [Lachnospiraceae bacterium]MDD3614625.1 glucosaminidase domain-containing protein [Lachnospiraceae bacterium]